MYFSKAQKFTRLLYKYNQQQKVTKQKMAVVKKKKK